MGIIDLCDDNLVEDKQSPAESQRRQAQDGQAEAHQQQRQRQQRPRLKEMQFRRRESQEGVKRVAAASAAAATEVVPRKSPESGGDELYADREGLTTRRPAFHRVKYKSRPG